MAADDTAGALRRLGCNHDGQHLVVVRKRRHVFVPLCRQLQLLLRNRVTYDTSAIAQATGSGLCAEEPAIAVAELAMARLIVEPLKGVEPLQLARAYKVQYTRSVMATRQAKLCRLCSDRRRRKMAKIGKRPGGPDRSSSSAYCQLRPRASAGSRKAVPSHAPTRQSEDAAKWQTAETIGCLGQTQARTGLTVHRRFAAQCSFKQTGSRRGFTP